MSNLILSAPNEEMNIQKAQNFCSAFCNPGSRPKYIFGRNAYAADVIKSVHVNGFIDDFSEDQEYLGLPVVKTEEAPADALVLIASGGKALTARKRVQSAGLECLDYFAFHQWSGLPLREVVFNEGFAEDFAANAQKYEWIYELLADETSKDAFRKLVSFRVKYDLDLLQGFTSREDQQYFEDFLELAPKGESFLDIGSYDGYTSLEFIKRCPEYEHVHIFEPEPDNFQTCRQNLSGFKNIHFHQMGLSDQRRLLKLEPQGSGSKITDQGSIDITVDRLDDILDEPVSFIKMDIEGAELGAIEGAKQSIRTNHPRLAISVYHNAGDFWKIPENVLAIRNDYRIYLRHYTESIYETVMFFIPEN